MENRLPVLQVRLFGKERITYDDNPILYGRNSVTKAMKMLLILFHCGKNGIPRNKLLEDLFGREELANASNNLRVTLHRLKKMLQDAGLPEHEYIVSKGGMFYWDAPMDTVIDTEVFKNLIAQAQTQEGDEQLETLREACQMYSGEFLIKLSGDDWVLLESVQYKKMYSAALQQLCALLMERREYNEVLKVVDPACEMYPFDEWQSIKIECYIAMNRYKDALKEYEDTAKLLIEELGISPSEKMMKQFKIMSEHISGRPQVITEIKLSLQETPGERGAFFCTYPGFRDAYRVMRRCMERTGQSIFLLLCTLTDTKGRPMEASSKLDEMSEYLFDSIKNSLRRSDSFTKFNQSQFLIMLTGTNEENCQIVIDRIVGRFSREHRSWGQHLEFDVSSLYEVELGEQKIRFL